MTAGSQVESSHEQPRAPNGGHSAASVPPQARPLPRPPIAPRVQRPMYTADDSSSEEKDMDLAGDSSSDGEVSEVEHGQEQADLQAQVYQQGLATGQMPMPAHNFSTGNLPRASDGAPPSYGSHAFAPLGPYSGGPWFTGPGLSSHEAYPLPWTPLFVPSPPPFPPPPSPPPPPPPPAVGRAMPSAQDGILPPVQDHASASAAISTLHEPKKHRRRRPTKPGPPRASGQEVNQPLGQNRPVHSAPESTQLPATASRKSDGAGSSNTRQRKRDTKIFLPAPIPTQQYLKQASLPPQAGGSSIRKLVILDLNGTLLHRPRLKGPKEMIERPFLRNFLPYLFKNFSIMVWSSARPENVKALVETSLGHYSRQLVACWGRDTLGLSKVEYNQNVQCYKNLHRVWECQNIQKNAAPGRRFHQNNTILIDDSVLKAAAQPHNLLEITEFKGPDTSTPTQDVLSEVVGYLEVLKEQRDVSKFMHKQPFRPNGHWKINWNELARDELAVASLDEQFTCFSPSHGV